MRLLIVTQAVDQNDPILGFFHQWLVEFAARAEALTVICLYEGDHDLPQNVRVHSLGKEGGRRTRLLYSLRFLRFAWKLRDSYDTVFVHMNPEYIVIAGPLWRVWKKKVGLWYMHKNVSWRLRIGVLFANYVFTASARSMRLQTPKKRIVGHGIRTEESGVVAPPPFPPLKLLSVGRLSRVKRTDILIAAVSRLALRNIDVHLTLVGGTITEEDCAYEKELHEQVGREKISDKVTFVGPVPQARVKDYYPQAHLFLHASDTGSLDKAVLEPLAYGVPVVTADEELAASAIPGIFYATPSGEDFAHIIEHARTVKLWQDTKTRSILREFVLEHHTLTRLIPKILSTLATK